MQEVIDQLIAIETRRRGLEEELSQVKEEKARIEEEVLEAFLQAGIQNVKLDGGVTIALRTDVRASIKEEDRETAYEAFKLSGFGDLVKETIHPRTLESWVREFRDVNCIHLPSWAEGLISTFEQTRPVVLGLKKGGSQ